MRLSFSTLGCPNWTLEEILEHGPHYGFDGVAFRGLLGELDLTKVPEFRRERRAASRQMLADAGLKPEMVLTSTRVVLPSLADRAEAVESAREHIDLARDLGSPFVRVFGGPLTDGVTRRDATAWSVEGLRRLGDHGAANNVAVLVETHDDLADRRRMADLMSAVDHPGVGVLWDVHPPFRNSGEAVSDTWSTLGSWVRSVDLKDSRIDPSAKAGYRYVGVGQGDVPIAAVLQLLNGAGYRGTLTFEWEKHWNSDLDEPEVALPGYVSMLKNLLNDIA